MIVDALLGLCRILLDFIVGLLPDAGDGLDLPTSGFVSGWFGDYAGPIDQFFPLREILIGLDLFLSLWMPVVLVYSLTKWIYRHLPMLGKG